MLRLLVSAPSICVVVGQPDSKGLGDRLMSVGLVPTRTPWGPAGTVCTFDAPTVMEFGAAEELMELIRAVGLPLVLHDGWAEFRTEG